jgi:hypothetical protein
MSRSSKWSLSFWLSHQNPIYIPLLPHSCYMPHPSHPPWLDNSNYTWQTIQVMNADHINILSLFKCSLKMETDIFIHKGHSWLRLLQFTINKNFPTLKGSSFALPQARSHHYRVGPVFAASQWTHTVR